MQLAAGMLAVVAASRVDAVVFTNVTASAGINHVHTFPELIEGLPGEAFFAGGAAAGDFDGDGHVDLVFTRLNDTDIFYRNLGNGTFEPRIASAGFIFPTYTNGVVSGDVDNDGDLDLYMTSVGYTRNYLYLNNGSGYFTDAGLNHPAALANGIQRSGQGASVGDYDRDGYLDLVTGDWGNFVADSQSRLLRNLGPAQPGHFEDATAASGINVYRKDRSYRYAPRLVDLDRDGHLDLAFAADFETSQLFWNNGDGTFTDGTLASGVGTDENGMGSTFGDYDSDGDLDWFITNITPAPGVIAPFGRWNRLYRNDGNRTFTDVTESAGVRDSRFAWGTTFFDYDNDGDVDLAATNGYHGEGWIDDRTFLWQNTNGVFTDVTNTTGVTDTQQGRGLIHLDYDEDGDLDLVVVNNAAAPILYRNDGGNANHYLRIDPQGALSNRDGIGTWITVTPDLDSPHRRLVWEIDGGSSFVSQSEHIAHFGLGASADPVDLIRIEWPATGIVQELRNVVPNQVLSIVERHPSDFNGDWQIDVADYVLWRKTLGHTVPHGTGADANGDSLIDINDYSLWRADFGATIGIGAGRGARAGEADQSVPEPTSHMLVLLAWICIGTRKTSRSDERRKSAQDFVAVAECIALKSHKRSRQVMDAGLRPSPLFLTLIENLEMFMRFLAAKPYRTGPLVLLLTIVVTRGVVQAASERPNILFIMSDDHAYQAISAYGSDRNKTPHIDRIAAEGMRFDRCYVTNSICGPSRACILTGKYSHKNGFYDNHSTFDGNQTTLPKLLQQTGYQTALVGKWHLVSEPIGFDHWDILPGQGDYYRPKFITSAGTYDVPGYVTDITTQKAIDWLRDGRDTSKPFFLMVHHKAPHRRWDPPVKYLTMFENERVAEPATLMDDYANRGTAAKRAEMRLEQMAPESDLKLWGQDGPTRSWLYNHMTPDERAAWEKHVDPRLAELEKENPQRPDELRRAYYQLYIKDYLRCVASVDDSVGALLDFLDQSGQADNTIVVYTSDQGFYLGEHGWFDKRFMYQQSLRTPLVMRWPGVIRAGSVEDHIVSNVDFAATFLEAAEATVPDDMQGRSLLPILRGESPGDWRKSFYYHYYEGVEREHHVYKHEGVTNGKAKLIHYYPIGEWEMFDLASDPDEMVNIYGRAEHAELQRELEVELARLRTELEVPPLPEGNATD